MTNAERTTTDTFERYGASPQTIECLRDLEPRHDVRGGYAPLFGADERDSPRRFSFDLVR